MGTDISHVFGMTCNELTDLIDPAVALGLVSIIALLLIHYRQHGLQKKLVSAQLSMKMLKHLNENGHKDFTDLTTSYFGSKAEEIDARLDRYLEIWEKIAVFHKEGTITKIHMKEFFKDDLRTIRWNPLVYGRLEKKHAKTTYHNLWKLMDKIRWPHSG